MILLAAVLTMSVSAAFSQGLEWGAKAGLNLAKFSKVDDLKMRAGFHVGVFAEKVVSDFFGVQGELLYSQMGAKVKILDVSSTTKYDYLTLPVLAKFYVLEGLSVDLGPQFGYMISAKQDKKSVYDGIDGKYKFDTSFGMGLSYKIGGCFDVTGRYLLGLTKLGESDSKNSVIQFGVGYRF